MQSINFPNDMSHHDDMANDASGKLLRWLPGVVLIVAVAAAALLGSSNKPGDELDWLSRLASEGNSGAQLQLGLAYRDGLYGLSADAKTGLYWLELSAQAGNPYAEDAVGSAYAKGQGTEKDLQAAKQWWLQAVKHGNKEARLHLGEELLQEGQVNQAETFLE